MNSKVEKLVRLTVEGARSKAVKAERKTLWDSLSRDEQQQTRESLMFVHFAKDTGLIADPYNHFNENPPRPDIRISINGCDNYFELGEITDEAIPKGIAESSKKRNTGSGCAFDQIEPLAKMLKQKCKKTYQTNRAPVELLLFYGAQSPGEEDINKYLHRNRSEVQELIQGSPYEKIWIYDSDSGKILWNRDKYRGWRKWLWLIEKRILILKRKLSRVPTREL
jgi:hypothetical protein